MAEAFTVTTQFVRQRVKLAELCEDVITAHRQGRCTLEQMAALTFGTHEQQRAIVAVRTVPGAYELRARLRGRLVKTDDARVKLIGMPAYTAAGGRLAEDLFASTAELLDAGLAQHVANSTQLALALVVQSWDRSIFGLCGQNELYTPWLSPWNGSSKACPTDRPDLPSTTTLSALHLDKVIREGEASAAARRKPYAAGAQIPLTWYIEQPKLELLAILSQCVARALCDPDSGQKALSHNISEKSREVIGHLVDATEFDLADVWQPSPEWLKSYGKAKTITAVASIGVEHIGGLSLTDLEQEKAAKVYELAALELTAHRWVPEFGQAWALRGEA